ncbi:PilW family protein [Pseudomonas sp. AN-1]|uniref:PilW family protein n=1 Tax=Pseudomonas sp. AN-1 TaxID=3096605 RepID=UPI002A6ABA00|nr:PilW family protein [Pseudomonas sp. AN-1]WPP45949.1 PilW family protein [Pseudomonas sp. AN-1]
MISANRSAAHAARHAPARPPQSGFSLIELMVASTVGLVIMLAILTLYTNTSRNNAELSRTSVLIESGRLGIQLLQKEIAHAGFWDLYVPEFDDLTFKNAPTVPSEIPDPCLPLASWAGQASNAEKNLLGIAVQVHDSVPSGCSTLLSNWKSGTDILVIRHARTCVAGASGCDPLVDGKLYLQVSRAQGGSACSSAIRNEPRYVLSTATGYELHKRDCSLLQEKRQYVSNIYYIRNYSLQIGDGIPTLVRSEFDLEDGVIKARAPVALIDGIEGLRVDLGIDRISDAGIDVISNADTAKRWTAAVAWANAKQLNSPINRGDGVPDEFVHCSGVCSIDRLANVVAVKVSLLARNRQPTQGHTDNRSYTLGSQTIAAANDAYKRHAFSTVVRLNNIAGRRETP